MNKTGNQGRRVAIVGAGPAALATIRALVEAEISCEVFDDNMQGGGQYFRQPPLGMPATRADLVHRDPRASEAIAILSHPLVRHHASTTVWSMPARGSVAFAGPSGGGRFSADAIVLATGAHDRPCPFDGWTLPGVISAGGCLNLLKGQNMLPGKRVAVVGNGPLVLVAAYSLLRAGAELVAVTEAAPVTRRSLSLLPQLVRAPDLFMKGLRYRAAILRSGATYREGWAIARAEGESKVERITIAPLDPCGSPSVDKSLTLDVDAVVAGYGLMPSGEIARMIECDHAYDRDRGGWIVTRSDEFETSVPGVFVIGDAAGIGGAEIALAEGTLLGQVLAHRLAGRAEPSAPVKRRLARLNGFRVGLEKLYSLPHEIDLATDDTFICRCEDVRRKQIVAAARRLGNDVEGIKTATRASMGRCQGRNCLTNIVHIAAATNGAEAPSAWPRMRPPARPIPIKALLNEPLGPAKSPDLVE